MTPSEFRLLCAALVLGLVVATAAAATHLRQKQQLLHRRLASLEQSELQTRLFLEDSRQGHEFMQWLQQHQPVSQSELEESKKLLNEMVEDARKRSLSVDRVQLESVQQNEDQLRYALELDLTGELFTLLSWIQKLQGSNKFVAIPKLRIRPQSDTGTQVSAEMILAKTLVHPDHPHQTPALQTLKGSGFSLPEEISEEAASVAFKINPFNLKTETIQKTESFAKDLALINLYRIGSKSFAILIHTKTQVRSKVEEGDNSLQGWMLQKVVWGKSRQDSYVEVARGSEKAIVKYDQNVLRALSSKAPKPTLASSSVPAPQRTTPPNVEQKEITPPSTSLAEPTVSQESKPSTSPPMSGPIRRRVMLPKNP